MRSYNDLCRDYKGSDLNICNEGLDSLDVCPEYISGTFNCGHNDLTSLVGGPQKVGDYYRCNHNHLTDLVGCASHIGKTLQCYDNNITSLVGIHKIIKSCDYIDFDEYRIQEGGIGLLLIDNLTMIASDSVPFKIISKYLGTGTKGMMECSKELISKGYHVYAKL